MLAQQSLALQRRLQVSLNKHKARPKYCCRINSSTLDDESLYLDDSAITCDDLYNVCSICSTCQ